MTWAVRATYIGTAGQSTSRSVTVPSTVQVGDLLFAYFYWDANDNHIIDPAALITPPAGGTWNECARSEHIRAINFDFYAIGYWRIATSADPDTTYLWDNDQGAFSAWRESVLVAFYNTNGVISPTGLIEASNLSDSDVITTAWTAPSSVSANNGALHIIAGSSWTLGAGSPPSGYNEAVDNASECQVGWKELGTAPVTTGTQFYDVANDVWAAISIIFKAPTGGTPSSGAQQIHLEGPNAQTSRPNTDITDGSWTNQAGNNTNLYDSIDEAALDDADYIQSELNPSSSAVEIGINGVLTPNSGDRVLKYRIAKDASAGNQINLTTAIVEGTTVIESWTNNDISNTFANIIRTLTQPITDYNNLRVRFTASQVAINAPQFVAAGTGAAANGGNVTPALPASLANEQILLCAVHSSDNIVSSMPSPWATIVQQTNTAAQIVTLFWKRISNAAGETAPLVTHAAGGVIIARIFSFSGCVTTGNPWNGTPTTNLTGTTAVVNGSSVTTTIDQSLALFFGLFEDDPQVWSVPSGWAAMGNVLFSALGADAAMGAFSKIQAAQGATGAVVTNLSTGTFGATSPRVGITLALSPIIAPGNRRSRVSWVEFETPPGSSGQTIHLSGAAAPTAQSAGIEIYLSGVVTGTPQSAGTQIHVSGKVTQLDGKQLHIAGFSTDIGAKQLHVSGKVTQSAGQEIYFTAPIGQTAGKEIYLAGRSTQTGAVQVHIAGKEAQSAGKEIYLTAPTGITTGHEIYLTAPTGQIAGKELYLAGRSAQTGGNTLHISGSLAQTARTQIHIDGLAGSITASNTIHFIGHIAQTGTNTLHLTGIVLFTNGQQIHLAGRAIKIDGTPLHIAGRTSSSTGHTLTLSGKISTTAGVETVIIGRASQSFGHELSIAGQTTGVAYSHTIHVAGRSLLTNGQTLYVSGRDILTGSRPIYFAGAIISQSGQQIHVSGRTSTETGQVTHISGRTPTSAGQTTWIVGHITQLGTRQIHLLGASISQTGQQTFISGSAVEDGSTTLFLRGEQIGGVRYINGSHQLYLNSTLNRSHGSRPLFVKSSNVSCGRETLHIEGEI